MDDRLEPLSRLTFLRVGALALAFTGGALVSHARAEATTVVPLFPDASTQVASPSTRAAIVERLRTELGALLKKAPAQLPIDTPVTTLGADDLDVVEWQMVAERTFRVDIDEEKVFDPKTRGVRKDLTISAMAAAVQAGRPWRPGRKG